MKRQSILPIVIVVLTLAAGAMASPYSIHVVYDFGEGVLPVGFSSADFVTEPPADPAQNYTMFVMGEVPIMGLGFFKGVGAETDPGGILWPDVCPDPSAVNMIVTVSELTEQPFGHLSVILGYADGFPAPYVFSEPGIHTQVLEPWRHLLYVLISGDAVRLDEIEFSGMCGWVANDTSSWSDVKALYGSH